MFQIAFAQEVNNVAANVYTFDVAALGMPWIEDILIFIKLIAGVFSVILFIAIVLVAIRSRPAAFIKKLALKVEEAKPFKTADEKRWDQIKLRLESPDENNWKLAVIEGDKFLDGILKRVGYAGENLGERLKQLSPSDISNLRDVWEAHKLRNNIVHDLAIKVALSDARRAVAAYERALKEMEIID